MHRDDNIEPIARAIAERIARQDGTMTEAEIAAWVERHWQSAAADLEAGVIDEGGRSTGRPWYAGLAAYRVRLSR